MVTAERRSLLLSTLAQVALSVELQPTLQILLDSLQILVPFDAGGIVVGEAEGHAVRAHAARGYPGDLVAQTAQGLVSEFRPRQPRVVRDVRQNTTPSALRASTVARMT